MVTIPAGVWIWQTGDFWGDNFEVLSDLLAFATLELFFL